MKKCILLVNGNVAELDVVRQLLEKLDLNCTITSVSSGSDALNQVMGTYPYHFTGKLKPDILLLHHQLQDMSGEEFLDIMRKYSSLEEIRIFMLSDAGAIDERQFEKFNVAGFIHGPFEDNAETLEKFGPVQSELKGNSYSWLSLIAIKNIGKAKASFIQRGFTGGIKMAAFVSGALIIGGAAIYQFKEQPKPAPVTPEKIALVDSVKKDTATVEDLPVETDSGKPGGRKVKSFTIKLPLISKSDSVMLNPATKTQSSNSKGKQKKYQIKFVPKGSGH